MAPLVMRVLVTGASGFIGRRLCELLAKDGHEVWALSRGNAAVAGCSATVMGDLGRGPPDLGAAAPDAVVHLAGESIASGRWTAAQKARIRDSRVQGTRHLAEALAQLARPPAVAICASAIGCYGDRGDELLTETSARGDGFLAEVTSAWEAEQQKLLPRGRTVSLRIGFVLGPGGGLPRMALPFRLFAGGPVGSGQQWVSWIHRDDVCGLACFALGRERLSGAVNAVAPNAVRNRELASALGKVLHRPSFLPAPAFALRLALGEMARELLLASQHVVPERALAEGYPFLFPQAEAALRDALV
ncbi:MAG: TIGR01777 family oxidoreductase [Myxococcales bacterium]